MGGRGDWRAPSGFAWPPPGPSTPHPEPVRFRPSLSCSHDPAATGPRQGAYKRGVDVRAPTPTPVPCTYPKPSTAAVDREFKPPASQAIAAKAPEVDLPPLSKKGLAHPARPGAGIIGKQVMGSADLLVANVGNNNLFHDDVSSRAKAVYFLPC